MIERVPGEISGTMEKRWSDDIQKGIENVLKDKADLKVFYLDTKRNPSKEFWTAAWAKAKQEIGAYQPA